MDELKWEREMMQRHSSTQTNWVDRPKLEIPNIEPTTPRRQGTSAQSPRGIYDFPISPQSSGEGILYSPPIKAISKSMWVPLDDYIDLVPNCVQFSPPSNHPGHGFSDCSLDSSSVDSNKSGEHKSFLSPSLNHGESVLVRCNQTKWLVGQVKCISNNSVKVWIGAAETLVHVPMELFPTHLARIECMTSCSFPTEYYNSRLQETEKKIRTQVHCVRPAHLSHRRLFQNVLPNNSTTSFVQQMCQTQCLTSTPTTPRVKLDKDFQCFTPLCAFNPSTFSPSNAYLEKKRIIPPNNYKLKEQGKLTESLQESNLQSFSHDNHIRFSNQQAIYNWRLHMAQRNQEALDTNSSNQGTPRSCSRFLQKGYNKYHHVQAPLHTSLEQYNINQELPAHACYEDSCLYTPHYEQFVTPRMVTKGTMTCFGETKKPPTSPPPQLQTKGIMDLRDNKSPRSPKRPPTPKGKETCEDQACPNWRKDIEFPTNNQGTSLERSVSLDSFKPPPTFMGLVPDPRSPGARPPRNDKTTTSAAAAPVWVTVIDNGHGTRKS